MFRMGQEEKDAVARVIDSKQLFKVNGGELQECANLEKEMREKYQIKHAVVMTSGTAALTSALIGMGVGPGDEVIIPAYTYIATAMAVIAVGAMPIVAEVDETLMIDPIDVEKKINERTKVIIPVHMMGYPCDMDAVMALAKKYGLRVLEDACQANGAKYKGRYLGTIGDAGAFSFNYFKIISAGEGGAMLTNDKEIFENGLIYHDASAIAYFGDQMNGFSAEPFCGTEFRTNEITAAILRVQLSRLDGIVADLQKNKKLLMKALEKNFEFIPLNDAEGDSSLNLTLKFSSAEETQKFADKGTGVVIPAKMGKHVYNDWEVILKRRGAAHPLMDPFRMEVNKNFYYSKDMCPRSLDIMSRCAHVAIDPDWTEEDIEKRAAGLIAALRD